MEIELVQGASHPWNLESIPGRRKLTPVFFGSAINNFGVREILNSLVDWAPAPCGARHRCVRSIRAKPNSPAFVFKIQANMDPKHRDRIAFRASVPAVSSAA